MYYADEFEKSEMKRILFQECVYMSWLGLL